MKRTGVTNLPLHYGKAPRWLFNRMIKLAREITIIIIEEFGPKGFIKKISDPLWFQSFGCVLGFDWHSSGITTTVCGALKEAVNGIEDELGIFIAGGKGGSSRKTPTEIVRKCDNLSFDPDKLIYASRIVAKVDNTAVQDGFQLYHHNFIFTRNGEWTIIQQGMNPETRYARRYHWLSLELKDFINEPHTGICCDLKKEKVLNMTAQESEETRNLSVQLAHQRPERLIKEIKTLQSVRMPAHHYVDINDINPDRLYKIFLKTYERKPENFEKLLAIEGVGPKTIRALSLIAELIYGAKPSYEDPVRYSFAHGGKDGHPYPVDRETYDKSIEILKKAVQKMRTERSEKIKALQRLFKFYQYS